MQLYNVRALEHCETAQLCSASRASLRQSGTLSPFCIDSLREEIKYDMMTMNNVSRDCLELTDLSAGGGEPVQTEADTLFHSTAAVLVDNSSEIAARPPHHPLVSRAELLYNTTPLKEQSRNVIL